MVSGEGRSLPVPQWCGAADGDIPMTNNWVDFKAIREQVSLEQVLFDFYKLNTLTIREGKAVGPCPVHGGDSPRAFSADFTKNAWFWLQSVQAGRQPARFRCSQGEYQCAGGGSTTQGSLSAQRCRASPDGCSTEHRKRKATVSVDAPHRREATSSTRAAMETSQRLRTRAATC